MNNLQSLLIVKDCESDSSLLINELKKAGGEPTRLVFDSEKQISEKLTQKTWDVIITENSLPGYGGVKVLKLIKELSLNIPCIIVCASAKEETVVEATRAGAFQCVEKDNLKCLVQAVKRVAEKMRTKKNGKMIEEELKKSEARYQALFEESPIPLWEEDLSQVKKCIDELKCQGVSDFREYFTNFPQEVEKCIGLIRITDINKSALKLYQASEKAEILNFPGIVFGKESYDVFKEQIIALLEGNTNFESELLTKTLSGEDKYVLFKLSVMPGCENTLSRVMVSTADITECKKAERVKLESEALFRALFETNQAIILMLDVEDKNLSIVNANEAAIKYYGYSKENLLNKTIMDLNVLPAQKVREKMAAARKQKKSIFELQHRLASGEIRDIESYSGPIDVHGRKLVYVVVHDITERNKTQQALKKSEEKLKESEQRYRNLAENSPNAIMVHCDGIIKFVNKTCLKLIRAESKREVIGKSIWSFIHNDFQNIVEKRVSYIYGKKGDGPPIEEKFLRLDGQVIDVEVAAARINFRGKPASQVVFKDITYRKRSEMIQDLLYNISDAVYTTQDLNELFKVIRDELSTILDTNNFYVAIYDNVTEIVTLPIFSEEKSNFKSFIHGKTLAAYVIEKNQATLIKKKEIDGLVNAGKVETFGCQSKIWLGVPLRAKNDVVGIIAVQSYTNENAYGIEELEILKFASDQIGLSIERKLIEIELKASLEEKIVLLKEIHHRVKNNLQVISSLLYLQSKYLTDEQSLSVFLDSQSRVRSMSLVHEKLYQSENLAKINFRLYINDLIRYLFRSYKADPGQIKLNLDIEDISLDVESAIPCGLIINELVSNSFKYAFPNQRSGEITIQFDSLKNDQYRLRVSDNGIGLKEYLEKPTKKTLGLQLVDTLVDQLHGRVVINGKIGSEFNILFFKDKRKVKRVLVKN